MAAPTFILSFFDYTGNAVRDWAEAGAECICYDIQHEPGRGRSERVGAGWIHYRHADLTPGSEDWGWIKLAWRKGDIRLIYAFPPCDDMAVSGAKHFARKAAEKGADFQRKAAEMAMHVAEFADEIEAPYVIENPNSVLSTLWRKPDHYFNPNEFGGYLPEDDQHPRHPRYIAPRDAYTKRTGLWVSKGFQMPEAKPVEPEVIERVNSKGKTLRGSRQFWLLGGKSLKTKNIRNETPRGFARASFLANGEELA
ncbi:hypothetical protein SAMN02983003_0603 [Devosia enhydra]|uniref:DNA (Cytosine-5)-methyltransferase 1 n=1 Tax=Devosia enhydra TaxID=665118 RepID=A0A1K2HTT2_9HYPH|nr:hypothetical protein [Devosia enhydra]SFZ81629.1 hypothetical protein SAMN02983003_0603 [Devosia enhydra]